MDILEQFRNQAKQLQKTIVLPEGGDARILNAAEVICKEKLAKLIILGDVKAISAKLAGLDGYTAIDPKADSRAEEFAKTYFKLREGKKGAESMEESLALMHSELFFATMLVREGMADGCLAGIANTTSAVLRAALRTINKTSGIKTISSNFIMATPRKDLGADGTFLFADCAVNPDPDAEQLADIAIPTAENCRRL
ncbi:MAG: phosphate acetyltransferase, partial [Deferribacteraceae bacterium]|nr:phosphate acetyltransferase [Deferribacteraceae bacterium]